jgi:RHS repeat-associated protein
MEKYVFKKLFTAAWMALLFTFCQLAAAATNVSVTATPSNPTAPATVTLAVSGDSDGNPIMVTRVEYFNGTTSLGVSVQSPFTLTLNDLAAGTYQISVKVTTTDPANPVLQSAPLAVTVGSAPGAATAYFIHTDQLNTPRAITDGSGNLVWQWDSDPFGKDAANEQPAGKLAFTFNQRFPGQQFDRESNLHYNYFRDYDPQTGRYIQSDPIGLEGGINTYGYVEGRPNLLVDPTGRSSLALPGVVGAGAGAAEGAGMASNPVGWVAAAGLGGYVAGSMISDAYRPQINDAVDWVFGDPMAAAQGNVADTQIEQDYGREASECKLGGKKPEDKCEWLERNASRYSPARVKATQKAWGCRGSRHGKGGKGR